MLELLQFIVGIIVTGDFPGMMFGIEEDSPIVDAALTLHDTLYCDPTYWYDAVTGILTPASC